MSATEEEQDELSRGPAEEGTEPASSESINDAIVEIREIPGTEGFYNAAAWESNGTTYLLGRRVEVAGEEGQPDVGSLVLLALGPDGNIVSSKEVWRPKAGENLLEDARALPLPDGRIAFGLTSLDDRYTPHPSVLIASIEELVEGTLPKPKVIRVLGKGGQTTPLGENVGDSEGKNVTAFGPDLLFAFRPEGNNHQLQVFRYHETGEATYRQSIDLPDDIPSLEYKVGTTMPPVWLNENKAILLLHGIKIVDGKFVYSITSSRLLKDEEGILSVDNVSRKPIIDPDIFAGMFGGQEVELHGERRVVYCCGGIPIYDNNGKLEYLKLYVNVGDKRTVEVTVSAAKLTEGWQISEPLEHEMSLAA